MPDSIALGIALSSGAATLCWLNGDGQRNIMETVNLTLGDARGVAQELAQVIEARGTEVIAVGVSIGGHVSSTRDAVIFAPQLITGDEYWNDVPLATLLRDVTGTQNIYVENDVNCMAEQQRSSGLARDKDMRSFAVVYLAPEIGGLGCGIYTNGTVLRGATGGAGEIGHLVVQPGGPRCRCGNRGCLQAMLSAENLAREVNWGKQGQHRSLSEIRALVDSGEPVARRAFERAGKVFGVALANLINLVDPGDIIIGGANELLQGDDEVFMDAMRMSIDRYSFSNLGASTRVWVEYLNVGTAAQGAASMARHKFVASDPA